MIYLTLFIEFFKIGLFAIGGGMATVPFLMELAERYPWFTASELANMIAISESTPGPIGINMATYAGYNAGGFLGGLIATAGLVAPSVIIIVIIAKFMTNFSENKYVRSAFYGIRPMIASLIGYAIWQIAVLTFFDQNTDIVSPLLVPIGCGIGILLLLQIPKLKKLHPICWILVGAVLGIILKL